MKQFFLLSLLTLFCFADESYQLEYELRSDNTKIGSLTAVLKEVSDKKIYTNTMVIDIDSWLYSYNLSYIEQAVVKDNKLHSLKITVDENGKKEIIEPIIKNNQIIYKEATVDLKDIDTLPFLYKIPLDTFEEKENLTTKTFEITSGEMVKGVNSIEIKNSAIEVTTKTKNETSLNRFDEYGYLLFFKNSEFQGTLINTKDIQ